MPRPREIIIAHMKAIGELLKEKNLQLDTPNPVLQGGFTQVPNFILRNPEISVGAKVAYAMFLSYAWHNDSCFPGQDRLADDMGLTRVRGTQLIAELDHAGLVTIQRRGQGKATLTTINSQGRPTGKNPQKETRLTKKRNPADIWR